MSYYFWLVVLVLINVFYFFFDSLIERRLNSPLHNSLQDSPKCPYYIYNEIEPILKTYNPNHTFWKNKQFGMFALEYLRKHPWRTKNTEDAKVIFVPNFETCEKGSKCIKQAHLTQLFQNCSTPDCAWKFFTVYARTARYYHRGWTKPFKGLKSTIEYFGGNANSTGSGAAGGMNGRYQEDDMGKG